MTDNEASGADPLGSIADEFVEAFRQGQHPTVEDFVRRYPVHADELREILPALELMEKAKAPHPAPPRLAGASPPIQQLGDYRILREVGHGGMGVVYEAKQLSLGRHVAIKVLGSHALLDPRQLARFQREARSAARLHHTNIVPVFGVGEQDGLHYYVMQFIQGLGLDLVLDELRRLRQPPAQLSPATRAAGKAASTAGSHNSAADVTQSLLTGDFRRRDASVTLATGPHAAPPDETTPGAGRPTRTARPLEASANIRLPGQAETSSLSDSGSRYWRSIARIGMQVADALAHAAGQGVLHRDIKPSNLLLDETGNVWVTDFGLAKAAGDSDDLTHTGDIVGTLRYMAPERFNGEGDPRSDIYSLGLTLYELLTLRPAFDETDRSKLVKQVMHHDPVPPRRLNPRVPRDLETVVLKAIARDPAHRYQTPAEMADDLIRFVEDRPVQARRISSVERLMRWARRNPQIAASLAGVIAIFFTGFALVSWSYFRTESALKEEAIQRQEAQNREKSERWERYRANMIAAGGAMQLHNVLAARTALTAAPEEHRNWEWNYFYHQLDTAQSVIPVGPDVQYIVFSADGAMAAVQAANAPARIWNLKTRQLIATLSLHGPANQFEFSGDNKVLAYSVPADNNIYLWDIAAGRERCVLRGFAKEVHGFHFDANGARLAAGSGDRTARVWDVTTGAPLRVLSGHEDAVEDAIFSPDGRRILTAGLHDRTARIWDAETGEQLKALKGHKNEVSFAIFNPQGDRVLTVEPYPSNILRLWEASTGNLVKEMVGHTNGPGVVAFSPDGSRIASGSLDWTIRLWDGRTGEFIEKLEGHHGNVRDVEFSPDGTILISCASDQTARLWSVKTGKLVGVLRGHTSEMWRARYTPDGNTVVTSSTFDGTVRLWDARAAERNGALLGHTSFAYDVAFHPDGERVVSVSWDGTARLWNASTGREISKLRDLSDLPADQRMLEGIAVHPGGRLVATAGRHDKVRILDLAANKELAPAKATGIINPRITFGNRSDLLAWGTEESVQIWDAKRQVLFADLHDHSAVAVAFNPDDSWLATGGEDRTVRIWDLAKQSYVRALDGHAAPVYALAVSKDGNWLASGSRDGAIRIWNTHNWTEVAELKHGAVVYGVAFSPDGTRIASACGDGMVRLWDTKTKQFVAELEGHTDYVHQVAFSPDGTRLVSCSGDWTARVWDSLSASERSRRAASKGEVNSMSGPASPQKP